MPEKSRMLTHQQAASFYNHLGAKQDWQAFFEAPATRDLITHASFQTAQAVFEFGCGTGAFAEQLLAHHLPPQATYLAVDSSATMVRLARSRLARFGERVTVRQTDGSLQFGERSGAFECFVSTYVLDLLSLSDMAQLLAEACRLLALRDYLPNTGFHIDYAQVITRFGVPSEVVVASKQSSEDEDS
jgi:ubiquinone/menaquinone biosynthesis C-methylase UbiE